MRKWIIIISVPLALASWAHAHGLARYVSTPITPPSELLWVLPAYALVFIVGNALFWKQSMRAGLARSILVVLGFLVCFAGSFYFMGAHAARATTAPPPGLGTPHPVFWGFTWHNAGRLFVTWNVFGVLFLGVWSLLFLKPWSSKGRGRWAMVVGNVAVYLLCILPYAVSGAWLHGWAGGYVHGECDLRLEALHSALVEYAETHEGRFPSADGMESLLKKLEPHLPPDRISSSGHAEICPLGVAYEREPKHYAWNTSFSGVPLRSIDPNLFYHEKTPISCPYHERPGVRTTILLRDHIVNERNQEPPNKTSRAAVQ